jgi:hypothetical protein
LKIGSRSRTRTCGMVVNSHPLYQLSYPGIFSLGKEIRLEKYHIEPVLSMGYLGETIIFVRPAIG